MEIHKYLKIGILFVLFDQLKIILIEYFTYYH